MTGESNTGGGSSLVQWLRLGAITALARVQSLVGELRSPQAVRRSQKIEKEGGRGHRRCRLLGDLAVEP